MRPVGLKQWIGRKPFKSIAIRLVDGGEFLIRHPECMAIDSGTGTIHIVDEHDQRPLQLDIRLIAGVRDYGGDREENASPPPTNDR